MKILAIVLAAAMICMAFAGCGGGGAEQGNSSPDLASTETPTSNSSPTPSPTPSPDPSASPGGGGGGGGTGGGGGLTLDSSTVSNNETDVELTRELNFVFSNNVTNLTVKDNNESCFSMTDETGAQVQINVILADDQLERDLRNDILIEVIGGMEPGKTYTIHISGNVMARNEATLGEDISFTFTTAAE